MDENRGAQRSVSMEDIIQKYANTVYRLAYSYVRQKSDADDIFQEVFLRYIRKAPRFEDDAHCRAWFIRVTVNCAKKHFSSAWRRHTEPLDDSIPFTRPEETGLHEALAALSPKYRTVIHLYYYEGYSTEEIGQLLGEKPSTVRTQLTRARKMLGNALKEGEYYE